MNIQFILLILAFLCFAIDASKITSTKLNLTAVGLALWVLSFIIHGK